MQGEASPVERYLESLPPERREAISAVRAAILEHLPAGYEEAFEYGMLAYVIPLERYPQTYNGRPLMLAALASQKRYMSLYLNNIYTDPATEEWFHERYRATGKRLDIGKSCVRFRRLDDLPLDLVGEAIERTPVDDYIAIYERSRAEAARARQARRGRP